jgi:glycosyltransferase involved in cell wall biosynthesis
VRTSILIVAYNEGDSLWKTVRACVETCGPLDYEIIVADDASTDGSLDEIQQRYPQVRVVRHSERERQGVAPPRRRSCAWRGAHLS